MLDEGAARAVGVQDAADAGAGEALFGRGSCHLVEHRDETLISSVGLGAHIGEYRAVGQIVAETAPGAPRQGVVRVGDQREGREQSGRGAAVKVAVVARGHMPPDGRRRRNAAGLKRAGNAALPSGMESEHVNRGGVGSRLQGGLHGVGHGGHFCGRVGGFQSRERGGGCSAVGNGRRGRRARRRG